MADATWQRSGAVWVRGVGRAPAAPAAGPAQAAPRYVFWLLAAFVVLEYMRPPVVTQLKLQMLMVLGLPLLWLANPNRPWTRGLTLQVLFLLWCVKSIPLAPNWFNCYFGSRIMYGTVAIGIVLVWVGSYLPDLRRVLWLWFAVMSYQAVWSMFHGGKGSGGFLGDENDLALACGTAVPFAISGFERLRGRARWVLGGLAALLTAGIVVSFSRGGFVGLVLSTSYLVFTSRHKVRSLALIAVGGLIVYAAAPQSYIDELRTIQETNEGTAKGRRFLWGAATNMYLAHPITGVGTMNASMIIGEYQPTDFEGREYNERDWSGMVLHSAWFTLLAEQGTVGTLIVLALMLRQLQVTRRLRRDFRARSDVPEDLARQVEWLAVGLNGALVGFIGAGTFLSVLYYPYLWYFAALAEALDLAARRELARLAPPAPQVPAAA